MVESTKITKKTNPRNLNYETTKLRVLVTFDDQNFTPCWKIHDILKWVTLAANHPPISQLEATALIGKTWPQHASHPTYQIPSIHGLRKEEVNTTAISMVVSNVPLIGGIGSI